MRNRYDEVTLPPHIKTQEARVAEELRKRQEAALKAMGDKALVGRPYNDELRRMGRL